MLVYYHPLQTVRRPEPRRFPTSSPQAPKGAQPGQGKGPASAPSEYEQADAPGKSPGVLMYLCMNTFVFLS